VESGSEAFHSTEVCDFFSVLILLKEYREGEGLLGLGEWVKCMRVGRFFQPREEAISCKSRRDLGGRFLVYTNLLTLQRDIQHVDYGFRFSLDLPHLFVKAC